MLTPAQIAAAITASRDEFEHIFLRAQQKKGVDRTNRVSLAAISSATDDRQAFLEAVTHACDNGWHEELITELIESDRDTGALGAERVRLAASTSVLQRITNSTQGIFNTDTTTRGLLNGQRWTGNVVVKGRQAGTGILMAPHLFLTAWHVIEPLFQKRNGRYTPLADVTGQLRIDFDAVAVRSGAGVRYTNPIQVNPHRDNWCPHFRVCLDEELARELPVDPELCRGRWDYAIIHLEEAVGTERNWASFDARTPVPRPRDRIFILQYPDGPVQRYHDHEIVAASAANRSIVPRIRFLHTVNTNPGSSGAPCFDKEFELIGLHQGSWDNSPVPGQVLNRGVPIDRIWQEIESDPDKLPSLDPSETPVWTLGTPPLPVIGCDEFLSELWAAALPNGKRVVSIKGEKGEGKTLRISVAEHVLREANHLKVVIDAPTAVARSAVDFATYLCERAGATIPAMTPLDENLSTAPTWRKDVLVPAVISALQTARNDRLTWILLKDLNYCASFGEGTSEVLYLLYKQALENSWLRFILDGMEGGEAQDVQSVTTLFTIRSLTQAEILQYLRRRAVELQLPPNTEAGLKAAAKRLHTKYQRFLLDPAKRTQATQELAMWVCEEIDGYVDQ